MASIFTTKTLQANSAFTTRHMDSSTLRLDNIITSNGTKINVNSLLNGDDGEYVETETFNETVKSLQESIDDNTNIINSNSIFVAELSNKIDQVKTNITTIEEDLEETKNKTEQNSNDIIELDKKVDNNKTELDNSIQTVKFDMTTEIANTKSMISSTSTVIQENSTKIEALNTTTNNHETRIKTLETNKNEDTELNDRVTTLETRVSDTRSELYDSISTVSRLESKVGILEPDMVCAKEDILSNTKVIYENMNNISTLQSTVDDHESRIKSLEEGSGSGTGTTTTGSDSTTTKDVYTIVSTLYSDLDGFKNDYEIDMESVTNKTNDHESRITTLEDFKNSNSNVASDVQILNNMIYSVDSYSKENRSKIEANESSIQETNDSMNGLVSNIIYPMTNDVETLKTNVNKAKDLNMNDGQKGEFRLRHYDEGVYTIDKTRQFTTLGEAIEIIQELLDYIYLMVWTNKQNAKIQEENRKNMTYELEKGFTFEGIKDIKPYVDDLE